MSGRFITSAKARVELAPWGKQMNSKPFVIALALVSGAAMQSAPPQATISNPQVSPEAYIDLSIAPGQASSWRITYEFYQVPGAR